MANWLRVPWILSSLWQVSNWCSSFYVHRISCLLWLIWFTLLYSFHQEVSKFCVSVLIIDTDLMLKTTIQEAGEVREVAGSWNWPVVTVFVRHISGSAIFLQRMELLQLPGKTSLLTCCFIVISSMCCTKNCCNATERVQDYGHLTRPSCYIGECAELRSIVWCWQMQGFHGGVHRAAASRYGAESSQVTACVWEEWTSQSV